MTKTIDDLAAEISEWQSKVFKNADAHGAVEHLRREAIEVHKHLWSHFGTKKISIDDLDVDAFAEECADVFFLLVDLERRVGFSLRDAVSTKFEKNKARTWKEPDEHGVIEHKT